MKKRLLSILCVISLCLTLLSVTGMAAAATTVFVGKAVLTYSEGQGAAYALTDDQGNVTTDNADQDQWNIKFENGTLTLKDADIRVPYEIQNYGIPYLYAIYTNGDLSI